VYASSETFVRAKTLCRIIDNFPFDFWLAVKRHHFRQGYESCGQLIPIVELGSHHSDLCNNFNGPNYFLDLSRGYLSAVVFDQVLTPG
jgi:hypothetical protein